MSASARKVLRGSTATVITSLLLLHVVLLGYPFWRLGDWLSIADPLLWLGLTMIFFQSGGMPVVFETCRVYFC